MKSNLWWRASWYSYIVVVISVLVTFAFKAFWPYNPVRIDSFYTDKSGAVHGEKVCVRVIGEKLLPVPVDVTIALANGESYQVMKYTSNLPPGTFFPKRCFLVPHIIPGKYRVRWTGVYTVNAFNHVTRTALTDWIEIKDEVVTSGKQGVQGKKGDKGETGRLVIFGK
jgi:hypothetical protein